MTNTACFDHRYDSTTVPSATVSYFITIIVRGEQNKGHRASIRKTLTADLGDVGRIIKTKQNDIANVLVNKATLVALLMQGREREKKEKKRESVNTEMNSVKDSLELYRLTSSISL